jgi:hypothetical protein
MQPPLPHTNSGVLKFASSVSYLTFNCPSSSWRQLKQEEA